MTEYKIPGNSNIKATKKENNVQAKSVFVKQTNNNNK